jgi:molybdenum cofactor cytidylyltransferase
VRPIIDGILLAAGESRRMGFPKPLLRIDNETFLRRTLTAMLVVARNVIVVTGAHEAQVASEIPSDRRVTAIHNPDFPRGQLSSLKRAISAIGADADAAIVHLADHPLVQPSTFQAVADEYSKRDAAIVIPRHGGRRGHPVVFAVRVFRELLAAPEDQGARFVVNADPGRVAYVDVADPGVTMDLDTPEDLERAGLGRPPRADGG